MDKFFRLKENNTTVSTEIMAGLSTFFAMSYIIFVNPMILSSTGMPKGAVFLATIIAAVIGTLVMGLFANVPYAQAPGMGLNAFFAYTVCGAMGYSWQAALSMVFLCGIINIIITVTKIRKSLIKAIPVSLQHAIGGGIGIFVAYIGIKNAGLLSFISNPGSYFAIGEVPNATIITDASVVPSLVQFDNNGVILALIGLVMIIALLILKVRGAVLITIIATTIIGIPLGVVNVSNIGTASGIGEAFSELGTTIGVCFSKEALGELFGNTAKLPVVLLTIFSFSIADTFDTIGTFIGTGRRTGIFSAEDEAQMEKEAGFKTKMDKALFADAIATSIGAIFGTSNTTTYVESAAGIEAGGRTGLTSVVTAISLLVCIIIAPVISIIPAQATAPVLIAVGMMMMASFVDVKWADLEEAIPAFFAGVFMAFTYSITNGIAFGFLSYALVKLVQRKYKELHPIMIAVCLLFIIDYALAVLIK